MPALTSPTVAAAQEWSLWTPISRSWGMVGRTGTCLESQTRRREMLRLQKHDAPVSVAGLRRGHTDEGNGNNYYQELHKGQPS